QPRPPKGEQGRPPCPHERIIALYHEVLPELRQIREWNETRRRLLQRRWSENPERQNLDVLRQFCCYVRESKFLMSESIGCDGRPFDCDLEWLIRRTNFDNVSECKYEDQGTWSFSNASFSASAFSTARATGASPTDLCRTT